MMEASDAQGFVDFANRNLHLGAIIPSMTQEEILFSCCPECFVGILFCEKFRKDEVMVISGVKRYSTYSGFGSTFRYCGFEKKNEKIHNILVMDASRYARYQFQSKVMQRDLNKAYTVFKLCGGKISTGHWGCGVFCGDKTLKFLQQLCAAATSGTILDYSTFSDEECFTKFQQLLEHCINNNVTVGLIFQLCKNMGKGKKKT